MITVNRKLLSDCGSRGQRSGGVSDPDCDSLTTNDKMISQNKTEADPLIKTSCSDGYRAAGGAVVLKKQTKSVQLKPDLGLVLNPLIQSLVSGISECSSLKCLQQVSGPSSLTMMRIRPSTRCTSSSLSEPTKLCTHFSAFKEKSQHFTFYV